jgi:hypothetical protein
MEHRQRPQTPRATAYPSRVTGDRIQVRPVVIDHAAGSPVMPGCSSARSRPIHPSAPATQDRSRECLVTDFPASCALIARIVDVDASGRYSSSASACSIVARIAIGDRACAAM